MKAHVKATGETVDVVSNGLYYESIKDERIFDKSELKIMPKTEILDYWTRLEHQAAIVAMGGMCGNTKYNDYAWVDMAEFAIKAAHALVEKMKEKRK